MVKFSMPVLRGEASALHRPPVLERSADGGSGMGRGGGGDRGWIGPDEIQMMDPLDGSGWDREVSMHSEAGPFHCSAWARVLVRTYQHRPCYLRLMRGGVTTALVPVMEVESWISGCRGVCVPFSDRVGPLVFDGQDPETVRSCLAWLARRRKWSFLEVRGDGRWEGEGDAPARDATYHGHRLALHQDLGALFSSLSASTRRAIRKSRRSGLEFRISRSWESMRRFVHLHERTRRRHGAPPQPMAFFRHLHEIMIGTGPGFVGIAEGGGRPVAAGVFLRFGSSAVYKFGASDPAAWSCRPNNLVIWEAIKTLAESGCGSLHFGRTDPGQSGLRRFKRSWGGVEEPLTYRRFHPADGTWLPVPGGGPGRAAAVFRRLPLRLNRIAGRLVYPHLD